LVNKKASAGKSTLEQAWACPLFAKDAHAPRMARGPRGAAAAPAAQAGERAAGRPGFRAPFPAPSCGGRHNGYRRTPTWAVVMEQTASLAEARAEAAARAARTAAVLAPLWRASRRWTAAVVLAAFPFLFILDRAGRFPVSPVLPGLVVLLLLILALPIALVEARSRRYRRRDIEWQARRALRAVQMSNAALGVAAVWLVAWFAVGT
jgi:hypothetical protein